MSEKPTYEELEQRIRELEQAEYERKLTEKALREKFGISGRQWVRKKFTTQKMCQQTVSLYRDLLG